MGQRAKQDEALTADAAAAAMFSSVTTAVFLFTVVFAVNAPLAISLAPACTAAALASALYGFVLHRRAPAADTADLPLGRPISLRAALVFGAVVSGVLVVSALLSDAFGARAALASVAAAGFADAHSGAISAALLERNQALDVRAAQTAVLMSFTTNAASKILVSGVSGPRGFLWRVGIGVCISVAAAWLAWWVFVD